MIKDKKRIVVIPPTVFPKNNLQRRKSQGLELQ